MGLFVYLSKTPRKRGFYLGLLPILYAPVRFGLDFLRATDLEQGDARYFGLTPGHYSAIVLLAAGVAFLRWVQTSPEPGVPDSIAFEAEEARLQAAATTSATQTKPSVERREAVEATSEADEDPTSATKTEAAAEERRAKKKKKG